MSENRDETLALHSRFFRKYWGETPFPLALERAWECRILSLQRFVRPVLDVGCGEGLFAKMLFANPIDTGIDPDPRELTRAQRFGAYKELICCSGDTIPKPDASYRTIFSNSVLEHIPDVSSVLRELYRLLAPGGQLFLTVPSHRYDQYTVVSQVLTASGLSVLAARYRRFFNRFWRHYHYYEPRGWEDLVRSAGFEVTECYTYGPKGFCVLNDSVVPLCLPGMILKRLFNRWTLFPAGRRIALGPLKSLMENLVRKGARADDGGLVFLALRKPSHGQDQADDARFAKAG